MEPCASKKFKTILQIIAAKSFQAPPEISSQYSTQNYIWNFEILKVKSLTKRFLFANIGPNESQKKKKKKHYFYKSQQKVFIL